MLLLLCYHEFPSYICFTLTWFFLSNVPLVNNIVVQSKLNKRKGFPLKKPAREIKQYGKSYSLSTSAAATTTT